jgi:ribosomal protein S27E
MINRFNHIRVRSISTLSAWEKEEAANRTERAPKSNTLRWTCKECRVGELYFDAERGELSCTNCGLVVERVRSVKVDMETQVTGYQPTLASSFGFGLGTPTPEKTLQYAVKQASKKTLSSYEIHGETMKLRKYASGKDRDSRLNSVLQHLTKRMQQIHGFDPTSDKDSQFADLNELGKFLRQARIQLRGYRFNAKKLVDALLVSLYGEKARLIVELPEKRLVCPRCRQERAYAVDKDPDYFLCVKCGKQVAREKAKFKVTCSTVDPIYLRTIERLVTIPNPSEKSNTALQVIGQVT